MSPFMRRVTSLSALKVEGTDRIFFGKEDLTEIPKSLAGVIEGWCKEEGVANTSLPSKGATSDEPLEVYYINLTSKTGQTQIKAMLKAISQPLVNAISIAANSMKAKTVFAADCNGPMDEIVALGILRNQLMTYAQRPPKVEGDDVALVIYV